MANEYAWQALAQDMAKVRDFVSDVRAYAIDIKALLQAGAVSVQNFPASVPVTGTFFQTTQPVSVSGTPNVAVTNTPVGTPVAVSLTATGDLVAAQAGVSIRLLAGAFGSTIAVTLAVRDGATDKIPLRVGGNDTVVLPFCPTGWMTTAAGNALRLAFSAVGGPTVTGYALWVAA